MSMRDDPFYVAAYGAFFSLMAIETSKLNEGNLIPPEGWEVFDAGAHLVATKAAEFAAARFPETPAQELPSVARDAGTLEKRDGG